MLLHLCHVNLIALMMMMMMMTGLRCRRPSSVTSCPSSDRYVDVCVCVFVYQGVDNSQLVKEISEQIESLSDSIGWAHDHINECQANIVHLEESKVCCQ